MDALVSLPSKEKLERMEQFNLARMLTQRKGMMTTKNSHRLLPVATCLHRSSHRYRRGICQQMFFSAVPHSRRSLDSHLEFGLLILHNCQEEVELAW
jgi:hypothetical protein